MNTVCCFPKRQPDGKPSKDHLKACRPNLKAQLECVESPWVLVVGAYALKAMVRHADRISPALGHIIPIHGKLLFPVLHPSFILRMNDPVLEEQWVVELERFEHLMGFEAAWEPEAAMDLGVRDTCFYCGKLKYPESLVCYKHRKDWRNDQAWDPVGQKKRKVHPDQGTMF